MSEVLDHVGIRVSDLGASRSFSTAALVLDPDGNNIEAVWHAPQAG